MRFLSVILPILVAFSAGCDAPQAKLSVQAKQLAEGSDQFTNVAINASSLSLAPDETFQLIVAATLVSGETKDVTEAVEYELSSTPALSKALIGDVAIVSRTGLVTGKSPAKPRLALGSQKIFR